MNLQKNAKAMPYRTIKYIWGFTFYKAGSAS